jgi:carboxymethylenebutenolidase
MGGGVALRAAADFPHRFAAIASFHGGGLATAAPDSPHLRIPEVTAELFFAGAEEDSSFSAEMQQRLRAALDAAGSRYALEVWAGARHGFSVPDSPAFRPEFGERHHVALQALLERTLG